MIDGVMNVIYVILYAILPLIMVLIGLLPKNQINNLEVLCAENNEKNMFYSIGFPVKLFIDVMIIMSLMFTVFYTIIINLGMPEYIYVVVGAISEILIILIQIVATMVALVIAFDKRIYVVFSVQDYLRECEYGYYCVMMILTGVIAHMMQDLKELNHVLIDSIRIVSTIMGLCYTAKCFWIEYIILFGNKNNELNILKKMYRYYESNNVYCDLESENIKDEAIVTNLDFLFLNYKKCYKRVKASGIRTIKFHIFDQRNSFIWMKWAENKFLRMLCFFCIVSFFMAINGNKKYLSLVSIIVCIILIIGCKVPEGFVKKSIINHLDGKAHFCITEKNEYYLHPYSIISIKINNYNKYVQSISSIIAFSEIIIKNGTKKKIIEFIENKMELIQKSGMKYGKEMLPCYLIGYVLYKEEYKINKLKKIYPKIEENAFEEMMLSFMKYIDKEETNKTQKSYIKWLSDKNNINRKLIKTK